MTFLQTNDACSLAKKRMRYLSDLGLILVFRQLFKKIERNLDKLF